MSANWVWSRSRTAGRLFLDEVGDLSSSAQAKLLTFLEQRTFRRIGATAVRRVDARVIAATNRNLSEMVAARTFREDLFYRLNAITVHLPPLRERPDDIRALAQHFLADSARRVGRRFTALRPKRWASSNDLPVARQCSGVASRDQPRRPAARRAALRPKHLPAELVAAALSLAPGPAIGSGELRHSDASKTSSWPTFGACWKSRRQPHPGGATAGDHPSDARREDWRRGRRIVTPATLPPAQLLLID